jgi:hypothetical protein
MNVSKVMPSQVNTYQNNPAFDHYHDLEGNSLTRKQKGVIVASAAAGMAPVLAVLAKRKGFSLNPAKIIKTPIKDWALFKFAPKEKSIEFKAWPIISIATGSVLGGFVGGAIVDKQNIKAKKREVLNQLLGNVLVPVACVASGAKLYSKYEDKIEGAMPQFKSTKKIAKVLNSVLTKLPNGMTTLGLLSLGIFLGNRVSNLINDKLYNNKVERNIRPSDFAPHLDDVCMATTMMNEDSLFGSALARIIPLALLVPGYETGIAQKK